MNAKNTQPKHPTILHFFTVLFNTEFFLFESFYLPTSPLMSPCLHSTLFPITCDHNFFLLFLLLSTHSLEMYARS